jgi:hypothetical protein
MFKYGATSLAHLAGVTPRLRSVFHEAIKIVDLTIIDGKRTIEEQRKNVQRGVSKTMASKHLPQEPDMLAHAVDAMPYPIDWNAIERGWQAMKKADPELRTAEAVYALGVVRGIAHMMGVPIRQGIDWNSNAQFEDQTFLDLPHTEIKR